MRYRRSGAALVSALVLVACGGDAPTAADDSIDGSVASSPSIVPSPTQPASSTAPVPSAPVGVGEWVRHEPTIDTTGLQTQTGEPDVPQITSIADAGDRLVAFGSYGGGFTVWTSADLDIFRPVYSEMCCERMVSAWVHSAVFGDRWLVGGSQDQRSFVWWSDDEGATWNTVEHPLFAEQANRIDGFTIAGGVVIVHAVNDSTGLVLMPAWSTDLVNWTPLAVPSDAAAEVVQLLAEGSSVWAIGSSLRADGGRDTMWWQSDDGGRTFGVGIALPIESFGFERVGDTLVVPPYALRGQLADTPARAVMTFQPDGSVTELPVDTGQWGDGGLRYLSPSTDPTTGRRYAILARERQANVLYCFADPDGCWQPEAAIVSTVDGLEWSDVEAPPIGMDFSAEFELSARSDGRLLVVTVTDDRDEQHMIVDEWTGPDTPALFHPPSYPEPDRSIPLYEQGTTQVAVGETYRYPLGIGGCSGLYLGDVRWEPDQPLPDPIPDEWPMREVEIADGPSAYVFGTVTLLADDTVEFGIEGIGTVAVYHPRPDDGEFVCG